LKPLKIEGFLYNLLPATSNPLIKNENKIKFHCDSYSEQKVEKSLWANELIFISAYCNLIYLVAVLLDCKPEQGQSYVMKLLIAIAKLFT